MYLCIYVSIYVSIYLSTYIFIALCLSVCLSLSLHTYMRKTHTISGPPTSMANVVRRELRALGTRAEVNNSRWLFTNMSSSAEEISCMRCTKPPLAFPLCAWITWSRSFWNGKKAIGSSSTSSVLPFSQGYTLWETAQPSLSLSHLFSMGHFHTVNKFTERLLLWYSLPPPPPPPHPFPTALPPRWPSG